MDQSDDFSKTVDACVEHASQFMQGSLNMVGKCSKRLQEARPNAESLGSAFSSCAAEISATVCNAALLVNRSVQFAHTLKQSEPDQEYYDDVEERVKKDIQGTDKLTDALSKHFANSAVDVAHTRAFRSALSRWTDYSESTERKEPLRKCNVCSGLQEKELLENVTDPNLEWIGIGEKAMAQNLRLWCTPYGEEKGEELTKSSAVLFRFARLYLHKASCATSGILQKLSYIRCAALLHASRIRFEQMKTAPEEFHQIMQKFLASLIKASGAKGVEEDFGNAITEISVLIRICRGVVKTDLKRFDEKRSESAARLDEIVPKRGRIEGMKALNENMTENYVSLMRNVARRCKDILGIPPMRFTIVGLGSMARNEITLYSDFEHVILIEEGSHREDVLEYFRWFAVIFQIVVIGFGETIVPSVCVRSINNLYSSDKVEDCWFYDIITPCGIAFDGMAPQSCATPLGQQIFRNGGTGQGNELIKTPSEMISYLQSEADTPHGFNLKDLLWCTCFVFGDESVYNDFLTRRKSVLAFGDDNISMKQHVDRIVSNRNPQVRDGFFDVKRFGKLDAKAVYYRPFSVLIGSLGRIHKVTAIGTFEVLRELKQKGAINEILFHKLSYAFAVSCEMRVRAYSKMQTQRRVLELETIQEMVGEEADWTIKDMMQYLQDSIPVHKNAASNGEMFALRSFNDSYVADCPTNEVRKWYFCSQFEKAVEIGFEYPWVLNVKGDESSSLFQYWLFKSCFQAGRPAEKRMYWDSMRKMYLQLTHSSSRLSKKLLAECHCVMAEVYAAQKSFRDAYDTTKKWLMLYLQTERRDKYRHLLPVVFKNHLIAAQNDMLPSESEAHKFLQNIFSQQNSECSSTLRCLRFMTSKMDQQQSEVNGGLLGLAEEIMSQAREIAEPRLLLKIIWAHQVNNGQWRDAMITADYMKQFPDISCNELEHSACQRGNWHAKSLLCAVGEICKVIRSAVVSQANILDEFL